MRLVCILLCIYALTGCNSGDSENGAYSFDQIIELRLNDDESINGKEMLINSILSSAFTAACPAINYQPCVTLPEEEDLSRYLTTNEYGHSRNSGDTCNAGLISLVSEDKSAYETLAIDYNEHTEFYMITEDKAVRSQFLAKVEFTEEIDYCAKKIYKGTRITLSDGEHQKVLGLFLGGAK